MNNKSKKRVFFISGILSFMASVVILFKAMFIILNYMTKDYTGAVLAEEQNLAIINFVIALGFVVFATYCVHKASGIKLDAVSSDDKNQADEKTSNG